jgi:hypothetical protein
VSSATTAACWTAIGDSVIVVFIGWVMLGHSEYASE